VGATRVSVDSLGAMFSQFSDQSIVRRELFRIASALKGLGVTAVLTAERTEDYGPVARFGVGPLVGGAPHEAAGTPSGTPAGSAAGTPPATGGGASGETERSGSFGAMLTGTAG